MRIALDTNRYIDLLRNVKDAHAIVDRAEELFVPFVVLAELRCGFLLGNHPDNNERSLQEFLNAPGVSPLFADAATTHVYADIVAQQRRRNALIPENDLWIASLAIQHGLVLFTRDRHFAAITRLSRI